MVEEWRFEKNKMVVKTKRSLGVVTSGGDMWMKMITREMVDGNWRWCWSSNEFCQWGLRELGCRLMKDGWNLEWWEVKMMVQGGRNWFEKWEMVVRRKQKMCTQWFIYKGRNDENPDALVLHLCR